MFSDAKTTGCSTLSVVQAKDELLLKEDLRTGGRVRGESGHA
jgi:hypothetical protein